MTSCTTRGAIDDLFQVLKDLEQPNECVCDPIALDHLRQIVLHCIGTLAATEEPKPEPARAICTPLGMRI